MGRFQKGKKRSSNRLSKFWTSFAVFDSCFNTFIVGRETAVGIVGDDTCAKISQPSLGVDAAGKVSG